ncbi:hypothetical protein AXG93_3725s1030 [Marchantia polymorpha subsp. ruderalis]|uniref:Uncharacterized protein n=1 Tax=Marchantia polymorpha subsp. ruderalis TaxID=1480154 RepID=A0A176VWR7_MARPO|nr:hypothetical protein AXG93_3725s1030 [Marchantia polymorpha subsp. ruderalis]
MWLAKAPSNVALPKPFLTETWSTMLEMSPRSFHPKVRASGSSAVFQIEQSFELFGSTQLQSLRQKLLLAISHRVQQLKFRVPLAASALGVEERQFHRAMATASNLQLPSNARIKLMPYVKDT